MATLEYDITHYQPILFGAESIDHMVDAVGSFFAECDDETPARFGIESAAVGQQG
jgi:phenylalanine-4-hydroxylase